MATSQNGSRQSLTQPEIKERKTSVAEMFMNGNLAQRISITGLGG
jgi:hypothetical protein